MKKALNLYVWITIVLLLGILAILVIYAIDYGNGLPGKYIIAIGLVSTYIVVGFAFVDYFVNNRLKILFVLLTIGFIANISGILFGIGIYSSLSLMYFGIGMYLTGEQIFKVESNKQ